MQVDLARYDDVVHSIYDAALRPEQWPAVVRGIARLFDATRGMLFTWAHSPSQGGFNFAHNMPQAVLEVWGVKSMHEDPFIKVAVERGLMTEGVAVVASDLVPMEALVHTEFYKELWQPEGIGHMCCGVVFDATDAHKLPTAFSVLRESTAPPFLSAHAEILRRLLAHMSRAMGVMFHLRDSQWRVAANEAALDRLASGVVLFDDARRVLFANRAAQAMFDSADTVRLNPAHGATPLEMQLHQRLAQYDHPLQQAIGTALQPLVQDAGQYFGHTLLLPGDKGEPRCVIQMAPFVPGTSFESHGNKARAIAFIYDLQSAASVDPDLLCKLFDMSKAEARAALQMTQGGTAEQIAQRLGISVNTFKAQLQAAYTKSGTHRQADLLKLLLALASH